ncbi:MAG: winged helix-turn-helix transcriptional regulator [Proteobacteria bacterium]|nr:MAG: winged helix-turn-helix transcriptional regulator [Pseudomonadota bacterium]
MTRKTNNIGELDQYDTKILDILSQNGRITVTELANQVGLSKTPCQARMKRLESRGYIRGYRAVLDPERLGAAHVAFVEVKLDKTTSETLDAFNRAVHKINEVEQCHMIAGGFDYLLKIRARDIHDYRTILTEKISSLPHVAQTSNFVSMQSVKDAGS